MLNIVTSSDHGVGALLSKDPRVDMVSFTGSTATGRAVMADGAGVHYGASEPRHDGAAIPEAPPVFAQV